MQRKNWVLLALASVPEGRDLTPAQLQKSLFLLGKEMPGVVGEDFYSFIKYHYGPFDSTIYHDADALESEGLVTVNRNGRWRTYSITPAGIHAAKVAGVAPQAQSYLAKVVNWARSCTFQQLVQAIYSKYPEYKENSVFQG